jgi:hypothetical protein
MTAYFVNTGVLGVIVRVNTNASRCLGHTVFIGV